MSRLRAQALCVHLGGRPILHGIDCAAAPGVFTVLVGPNGAGKTTLLRALAGFLPPASGDVLFEGLPLHRMRAAERARRIAYLPQGGTVAWPLPVADVVALGRLPHGERPGSPPPEGAEAVAQALAAVGLQGFEKRSALSLSGGERARVLLARALATEAPVLLADEPVAALDPRHQLIVLGVLQARARAGAAVVAVMHDLSLAARFADRVALLDGGRMGAAGPPADVFTPERLARHFGVRARISQGEQGLEVVVTEPVP